MVKYSSLILLIAVAVFWSSASAKPRYNSALGELVDSFTKWAIEEIKHAPEPHKSKLTTEIEEAKHKHWNDLGEYLSHLQSIMQEFLRVTGAKSLRNKRQVSSESDELFESDELAESHESSESGESSESDENEDSSESFKLFSEAEPKVILKLYTDFLVAALPKMYSSDLRQKFDKALEKEYSSIEEFEKKLTHIVRDVTGV